jgi:ketosteroid isomerase-like protein
MSGDAATPDPDDAVRAELVAVEKDWARAIVSNDAARIAGFMADDWVVVSDAGITAAERFLAVLRSGALTHSAMVAAGVSRVRVYGDTAVVTVRVTSTAHYQGQRLDADEWTTDVFVRRAGRWLCVLTHLTAAAPGLADARPEAGELMA